MEIVVFYLFGGVAVFAAALVVLLRRAVYSALALIVCLGSIAVLFFQLGAHFIAAIQVIVYAGAIMVLFLFVIMLLDPESEIFSPSRLKWLSVWGSLAGGLLAFVLLKTLPGYVSGMIVSRGTETPMQNVTLLARQLFREYLLPFEVTSILILVAVMGAIVLTKRPE